MSSPTHVEREQTVDVAVDPRLSRGVKAFLQMLNASGGPPLETLPPLEARAVLANAQASVPVDLSGIAESEKTINADGYTIPLNIVRPAGATGPLPVFIFIHGGGWVLGDYPTHKRMVRDLVVLSGFPGVFVNYTRTPEARYPQAVNEIYAATKWVAAHGEEIGVDGQTLAVVGNSVGGNMTAVTALKAKEQGGPAIKLQIMMWPIVDATFDTESYRQFGEKRFLTTSFEVITIYGILRLPEQEAPPMAHLRFTDVQDRPTEFLDFTSVTLDEFQLLVPPFEAAFQAHMASWRLDGKPRTARRFAVYKNCPLATPEDQLFFILVYLKTYALQVVQGRLFGMGQSKANQWIHVLLPVLLAALRALGDAPTRSLTALAQRLGVSEIDAATVVTPLLEAPAPGGAIAAATPASPLVPMTGPNDASSAPKTLLNRRGVIAARKRTIQSKCPVSQCATPHPLSQ